MEPEAAGGGVNLDLSLEPLSQPEPERVFVCIYCKRKFQTSQALGGHQNAHKLERSIRKTRETAAANAIMRPLNEASENAIGAGSSKESNYVVGGHDQIQELGGVSQMKVMRSTVQEEEENYSDGIDLVLKL